VRSPLKSIPTPLRPRWERLYTVRWRHRGGGARHRHFTRLTAAERYRDKIAPFVAEVRIYTASTSRWREVDP
jgi:hypothetical protein